MLKYINASALLTSTQIFLCNSYFFHNARFYTAMLASSTIVYFVVCEFILFCQQPDFGHGFSSLSFRQSLRQTTNCRTMLIDTIQNSKVKFERVTVCSFSFLIQANYFCLYFPLKLQKCSKKNIYSLHHRTGKCDFLH